MSETMQVRQENKGTVTDGEAKRLQNEAYDRQERIAREHREEVAEHLSDLDGLLDEIDLVLEENAEEFVNQYIQKGGE